MFALISGMVSSTKYGKEHMTGIGNLMAAVTVALTRRGRGFLKSMPARLVVRLAISFVLAASLYANEFNNPTPTEAAI
ncbi:MAG TPA: hypothetical protein VJM51_04135, partial [Dehalococcoidia bacterium]|nr:hypothetical protein [Dehalococcoidia bacterium]